MSPKCVYLELYISLHVSFASNVKNMRTELGVGSDGNNTRINNGKVMVVGGEG